MKAPRLLLFGTGALILSFDAAISIRDDGVRKRPVPPGVAFTATTTHPRLAALGGGFPCLWNVKKIIHDLPRRTTLRIGHAKNTGAEPDCQRGFRANSLGLTGSAMSAILCDFERGLTALNPTTPALRDGNPLFRQPRF